MKRGGERLVRLRKHKKTELLVSAFIDPIAQFGRMGVIQAVFEGSFNVKVKDQIIHFASYKGYVAGHGIYVPRETYSLMRPYLAKGNRMRITENQLTIYSQPNTLTIDYEAKVISQKIDSIQADQAIIKQVTAAYDQATRQGLRIGLDNQDEDFKKVQTILIDGLFNKENVEFITHYLVGRGRGLTPSGDDMLVGYLSVIWQFAGDKAQMLADTLKKDTLSTTDVSKAYLLAAANGHFSTPLYKFYQAVNRFNTGQAENLADLIESIEWIMKIGHTSGQDMTYGMGMAFQYLNNQAR